VEREFNEIRERYPELALTRKPVSDYSMNDVESYKGKATN
jgi:hypothetical protein